jgi:hypothetical protein
MFIIANVPIIISRGEAPALLTYGRLHEGSIDTKGFTCSNPNVKVCGGREKFEESLDI